MDDLPQFLVRGNSVSVLANPIRSSGLTVSLRCQLGLYIDPKFVPAILVALWSVDRYPVAATLSILRKLPRS